MKQAKVERCEASVTNDSGNMQLVKVEIHATDVSEDVENYQQYGLAGNVGSGSALVFSINGTRFVLGLNKLEGRPGELAAGEVMLWSEFGQKVHLKDDGNIEITASETVVNGELHVRGEIKNNGQTVTHHTHGGVLPGGSRTDNMQ